MRTIHVFNVDEYHQALSPLNHSLRQNQRGGGLGGAFGVVKRYSIPLLRNYVLPHVKSAVVNTARDYVSGTPFRSAVKKNAVNLLGEVGRDVLDSLVQKGKGITRRQAYKRTVKPVKRKPKTKPRKNRNVTTKKPRKRATKKIKKPKSKVDIFS